MEKEIKFQLQRKRKPTRMALKSPKEKMENRGFIRKQIIEKSKQISIKMGLESKNCMVDQMYQNPILQSHCSKNTLMQFTYEIGSENLHSFILHGLKIEETNPYIALAIEKNEITYIDLCDVINIVTLSHEKKMEEYKVKNINYITLHEYMLKNVPKLLKKLFVNNTHNGPEIRT